MPLTNTFNHRRSLSRSTSVYAVKPRRKEKHALLVHGEVQVRLGDHYAIQQDVEHDAEEHRAIAAGMHVARPRSTIRKLYS